MATCELCGQLMPDGEEMFRYHGHSGPCPKQPMKLHFTDEWLKGWLTEDSEVDFEVGPEIEGSAVFTSAIKGRSDSTR
jgi:hypothetical protein